MTFLDCVDASWMKVLNPLIPLINEIEFSLGSQEFLPKAEEVFIALRTPIEQVRAVIFGQDPYPTPGNANGLAFSVSPGSNTPASLRNIFIEYQSDLEKNTLPAPDLSTWSQNGVLLLNRVLTVSPNSKKSHAHLGWERVTTRIAQELGTKDIVAILWGNRAQELKKYFRKEWVIESVHPSPLSAYRGFFGSKPFSKTNEILRDHGLPPISW
jgi:uracil-DNA glycosylase